MPKIPNIVPITDLRQDATSIVKRVAKSREPLIITQRGRATAVMVSIKDYEHSQHELELLRLLARGERKSKRAKAMTLTRFSRRPTSYYKSCNGESPFHSLCSQPSSLLPSLIYIARIQWQRLPSGARQKRYCSRLRKFPTSGRTLPEFPDLPFREVIIAPYRFFYRVKGKVVWIVAVWHSAQLPKNPNETEGTS